MHNFPKKKIKEQVMGLSHQCPPKICSRQASHDEIRKYTGHIDKKDTRNVEKLRQ